MVLPGWMKTGYCSPDSAPHQEWIKTMVRPASKKPFNGKPFHFHFRWFWDYAGGLMMTGCAICRLRIDGNES